ncbi:hypothetical protein V8G54_004542, partial [Vigna mungo]
CDHLLNLINNRFDLAFVQKHPRDLKEETETLEHIQSRFIMHYRKGRGKNKKDTRNGSIITQASYKTTCNTHAPHLTKASNACEMEEYKQKSSLLSQCMVYLNLMTPKYSNTVNRVCRKITDLNIA